MGFEPTLRLPVNRISSAAHSTSLPPLRKGCEGRWNAPGRLKARRLAEAPGLAKTIGHKLWYVARMRSFIAPLGIARGGNLAPRMG